MKLFWKYWKKTWEGNRFLASSIFALAIAVAFAELSIPAFFKFLIDRTLDGVTPVVFALYFGLFLLCQIAQNLLSVGWYQLLDLAGVNALRSLRNGLFAAMAGAPYRDLIGIGKEKLKNILYADVMTVLGSMTAFAMRIASNLLMLAVFLGCAAFVRPELGAALLGMFVAGFSVSAISRTKIRRCSTAVNAELKKANAITNSFVDAIELHKTNSLGDYAERKHAKHLDAFLAVIRKNDFAQVLLKNLIGNMNSVFALLVVVWIAAFGRGATTGDMLFMFFVSNMVFSFSSQTEQLFSALYASLPSYRHIDEVMELGYGDRRIGTWDSFERLEFENVAFGYAGIDGKRRILDGVSLSFSPGERVRVAGGNGSGKSTFVKLLAGLLEPDAGTVALNGKPLSSYDSCRRKGRILYVSQDEYILDETVMDYARSIKLPLSRDEAAGFLREWRFFGSGGAEGGLDTKLEDNARNLSGGQRKKLLAMKLFSRLKDADIVIIDELEAGMDAESVRRYRRERDEILGAAADKLVFEITHRKDIDPFHTRVLTFDSGHVHST